MTVSILGDRWQRWEAFIRLPYFEHLSTFKTAALNGLSFLDLEMLL